MLRPGLNLTFSPLVKQRRDWPPLPIREYVHKRLSHPSEVRLLHLHPGSGDAILEGSIKIYKLDQIPRYKTLSYVWGSLNCCQTIRIDSVPFHITHNLALALRRVRSKVATLVIWIDALCINQKDVQERNKQVRLMKRIYSECSECLIYVGEDHNNSHLIKDFLVGPYIRFLRKVFDEDTGHKIYVPNDENQAYFLPPHEDPVWDALGCFIKRPWFRRIWVIQEYVFPDFITLICGNWTIDGNWPCLLELIQRLFATLESLKMKDNYDSSEEILKQGTCELTGDELHLSWGAIGVRCDIRALHKGRSPIQDILGFDFGGKTSQKLNLPLVFVLSQCQASLATDPKDHFFAVLGLATDAESPGLDPDYNENIQQISLRYARHFVRHDQGIRVLKAVTTGESYIGLPSWIPHWTSFDYWAGRMPNLSRLTVFENNNSSGTSKIQLLDITKPQILITGHVVDVISEITVESFTKASWEARRMHGFFAEFDNMCARYTNYPTEENIEEARWRTLIGNEVDGHCPAPADFGVQYTWMRQLLFDPENWVPHEENQDDQWQKILSCMNEVIKLRHCRFCVTEKGYFGMVPQWIRAGDSILIAEGDNTTFAIRSDEETPGIYTIHGPVYIHNILLGERDKSLSRPPIEIRIT